MQVELQKMFNDIKFFTNSWWMKINAQKCETILFRNSLAYTSRNLKRNWRDFHIVANEDSSERIPHKKCVRYLGVRLDERLQSASHGENPWVSQPFYPNDGYFEKTLTTGFIPPEAFVHLDRNGLILDSAGD